jgi:S1-C subfamily serine protease
MESYFDLKNSTFVSAIWSAFQAKLVAQDEKNDVALLKVDAPPFGKPLGPHMELYGKALGVTFAVAQLEKSWPPQVNDEVTLMGYPLGEPYLVAQRGTIASIAFDLPGFGETAKLLLSMVANPGNSGAGKVIGLLEGGLPSRPDQDAAQFVSGIDVVVPIFYGIKLIKEQGIR